jgi:WD40 repeat protein
VTVSSDKKVFLYNGLNGEIISELFTNGHTGGILSCDWLEDSNSLATASSDKQIRVWNVPTQELLKTLQVAAVPALQDQQVKPT